MGKSVNQVFFIGRVMSNVDVRTTKTGKTLARFTLAVDKATAEGADFFECVAWGKTAELLKQYTAKGTKIHVQGSLQQRIYEAQSFIEVVVRDVTFLDKKPE